MEFPYQCFWSTRSLVRRAIIHCSSSTCQAQFPPNQFHSKASSSQHSEASFRDRVRRLIAWSIVSGNTRLIASLHGQSGPHERIVEGGVIISESERKGVKELKERAFFMDSIVTRWICLSLKRRLLYPFKVLRQMSGLTMAVPSAAATIGAR